MAGRKRYSREFKREAVQQVTGGGVTLAQASRELGVHVHVLRGWVRAMQADPVHAFPGHGVQRPEEAEVTRLWREVARLMMERDIPNEAAAFFAKESI